MRLRTNKPSSRTIISIAGPLTIERLCLRADNEESKTKMISEIGQASIFPLDQLLGIDALPFKMTLDVMLEIAKIGVDRTSFEVAAAELSERFCTPISKDLTRDVALKVGAIVFEEETRLAEQAKAMFEQGTLPTGPQDIDDVLYISTDGAHLNTRELLDDKKSSYHENKLVMAFSGKDVITERCSKTEVRRKIIRKHYSSLLYRKSDDFQWYILALAIREEYWRYKRVIVLGDGASWIETISRTLFPGCQRILDPCHLKENVGKYGSVVYPKKRDEKKRQKWVDEICNMLDNGHWEEVIQLLEPYKNKKLPKGVPNLPHYLESNRNSMDYPEYDALGYILGSGSIESSNKSVGIVRFKQPGQRWEVEYGQYFLCLRCKLKGNEWDTVKQLVYNYYKGKP